MLRKTLKEFYYTTAHYDITKPLIFKQILGKTCLDTLSKMFEHRPDADHLPLSLNSQFLNALYKAKPNYNNQESALKWLHMMGEAVTNLVENSNAAVGKEDR